MKVETSPRGVLYKHEVITYLGGNEELFKSLCEDYGLRPVYKPRSLFVKNVKKC